MLLFWRRLPSILSFSLLAFQLAIPWTVPHFVTQDGPSHTYTAAIAQNLLLHRHSVYNPVYRFNPRLVPNWGTTIVMNAAAAVAGYGHAEQVTMSLCLLAGFFGLAYARKALNPETSPWTPLNNFLLQSWFLWVGFYNFYLGMALSLFVIGYYLRDERRLNRRRAAVLSAGLIILFFTHLIPAAIAALVVFILGMWSRPRVRQLTLLAATLLPVLLLLANYAASTHEPVQLPSDLMQSLRVFPKHVFATAAGPFGTQSYLWPAVLLYIAVTVFGMRRTEWRSARGALVVAALFCFLLYLIVPQSGFGGSEAKLRFAWAAFLLGGLLPGSIARWQYLRTPFALCLFPLLIASLTVCAQALQATSRAVDDYLSAADQIPTGSRFLRLYFPTRDVPARYGFEGIGRDPLFHLDAYVAARRGCVDLTDYQQLGLGPIFPVIVKPDIDETHRAVLWGMEGPDDDAGPTVRWLRYSLPRPIDYNILVGSSAIPPSLLEELNRDMTLLSISPNGFVRVFRRTGPR